jgi:hypothetical protein
MAREHDIASGDLLVDITAGTAVFSIGIYEAAVDAGANVSYVELPNPGALAHRRIVELHDPAPGAA